MIVSRGLSLSKLSCLTAKKLLQKNEKNCLNKIIIREDHELLYRKMKDYDGGKSKCFVIVGSIMWCWIFWNLFTKYPSLKGVSYPDPSEWTDEELGIPTD